MQAVAVELQQAEEEGRAPEIGGLDDDEEDEDELEDLPDEPVVDEFLASIPMETM